MDSSVNGLSMVRCLLKNEKWAALCITFFCLSFCCKSISRFWGGQVYCCTQPFIVGDATAVWMSCIYFKGCGRMCQLSSCFFHFQTFFFLHSLRWIIFIVNCFISSEFLFKLCRYLHISWGLISIRFVPGASLLPKDFSWKENIRHFGQKMGALSIAVVLSLGLCIFLCTSVFLCALAHLYMWPCFVQFPLSCLIIVMYCCIYIYICFFFYFSYATCTRPFMPGIFFPLL